MDDGRDAFSLLVNRSREKVCEYRVKCALSQGAEEDCSCRDHSKCGEPVEVDCALQLIRYPGEAIVAPFLYNRTRTGKRRAPDFFLLNGTVRCGNRLIPVQKILPLDEKWNIRRMLVTHFCQSFLSTMSLSELLPRGDEYESTDRCGEWNRSLV